MRQWIVMGVIAGLLWVGAPTAAQAYDPCATPAGSAMLAERRASADRLRARHEMIMQETVLTEPSSVDCINGILSSPLFSWAAGILGIDGLLNNFSGACAVMRESALFDLVDRCFGINWSSVSLGGIDGFGTGWGTTICGVDIGGGVGWDGVDFDSDPGGWTAPGWGGTGF